MSDEDSDSDGVSDHEDEDNDNDGVGDHLDEGDEDELEGGEVDADVEERIVTAEDVEVNHKQHMFMHAQPCTLPPHYHDRFTRTQ